VSYTINKSSSLTSSDPISLQITLDRESDDNDPDDQLADAPHFPLKKMVSWWLVVGDAKSRMLYAIKKVTVKGRLETMLEFTLGQGDWNLKLYLICDSYAGTLIDSRLCRVELMWRVSRRC
jgi:pre-mRNA-splicing helicase BRR2